MDNIIPKNPKVGMLYYSKDEDKYFEYNGERWEEPRFKNAPPATEYDKEWFCKFINNL